MGAEQKLEKLYQAQAKLTEKGWANRWVAGYLIVEADSISELLGATIVLRHEGWELDHFYEGEDYKQGAMTGVFNLVDGWSGGAR